MKRLFFIFALVSFAIIANAQNIIKTDSLGKTSLKSFVLKPTVDRLFLFNYQGQPLNLIRDPKSRELLSSKTLDLVDRHPVDKMPVLVPRGLYSLRVLKPDTAVNYSLRVIK